MKSKSHSFGLVLVVVILSTAAEKAFSEPEILVSPELEKALLVEDWSTVAGKYYPNNLASSPVLRAITGHACLALNQNNESLKLSFAPIHLCCGRSYL